MRHFYTIAYKTVICVTARTVFVSYPKYELNIFEPYNPRANDWFKSFDGVYTGANARSAEGFEQNANQEETYEWMRENWEGIREFTEANDMDFVPGVFPGYNDEGNKCWGGDRYTKRSPKFLRRQLHMAEEFATLDRVYLNSWNDWTEGHQIEPGSARGENYGTDYLEIIQEFQKSR